MKKLASGTQGLLITLLITINFIVVVSMFGRKTLNEPTSSSLNEEYPIKSLIESIIISYKTEGQPVLLNNNQDSLFLLNLIYGNTLVIRISDKQCESCTIEAFSDFIEYSSEIQIPKIILTSFKDQRSFEVFRIRHPNYVVLNEIIFDLPVERLNTPYFFLTDRTMLTDMVFVHQKEFPEKTKGYFEALKARLDN